MEFCSSRLLTKLDIQLVLVSVDIVQDKRKFSIFYSPVAEFITITDFVLELPI